MTIKIRLSLWRIIFRLKLIREVLQYTASMIMTRANQKAFDNPTHYHICDDRLDKLGVEIMDKVRDHYHSSEKYRGAAHNKFNLQLCIYPYRTKLPLVFHNLCAYDGHLIMSALGQSKNN